MKTLKELLDKDEIGKLCTKWEKEEFGKSPHGFDWEKVEGARLFVDFLRKELKK